jgi:hypothetical protein
MNGGLNGNESGTKVSLSTLLAWYSGSGLLMQEIFECDWPGI